MTRVALSPLIDRMKTKTEWAALGEYLRTFAPEQYTRLCADALAEIERVQDAPKEKLAQK